MFCFCRHLHNSKFQELVKQQMSNYEKRPNEQKNLTIGLNMCCDWEFLWGCCLGVKFSGGGGSGLKKKLTVIQCTIAFRVYSSLQTFDK